MTTCVECGGTVQNRSRKTMRCAACHVARRKARATGRSTGPCVKCGAKLSLKRNTTGHCAACYRRSVPRAKRGPTGKPSWNAGRSIYRDREHQRSSVNEARRVRRATLPTSGVIADRLRTLIRNSFRRRGLLKHTKTTALLGCSLVEFREHLERQFVDGMTWNNYGNGHARWNIDHIVPLSSFDLTSEDEQRAAFHYTNCQPLWALDNMRKANKSALAITATVTWGYAH